MKALGEFFGAQELSGVDIDKEAVKACKEKGIRALALDVAKEELPYKQSSFDLVMSLGMLDYLPYWDDIIFEIRRVLKNDGYVLISLPNLASWHNRIALLLGYQPRDVEVSYRYVVGVFPFYKRRKDKPVGHIHTITSKGFEELMECYGFRRIYLGKANTITSNASVFVKAVNKVVSICTSANSAKRFIYIGQKKPYNPEQEDGVSWWTNVLERNSEK